MKLIAGVLGCFLGVTLTFLVDQAFVFIGGRDPDIAAGWGVVLAPIIGVFGLISGVGIASRHQKRKDAFNARNNTDSNDL